MSVAVVMLLLTWTDTRWFHQYILGKAEVRFIQGRISFEVDRESIRDRKEKPMGVPFSSMVVVRK